MKWAVFEVTEASTATKLANGVVIGRHKTAREAWDSRDEMAQREPSKFFGVGLASELISDHGNRPGSGKRRR